MRFIKPVVIGIFIIVLAIFIFSWAKFKMSIDGAPPVIEMKDKLIKVSVKAEDKDLLKNVSAKDSKDGDLKDNVIVESISQFIDKKNHISNITYAVADKDNHVSKASRQIQYTDYTHPRFTLKEPLCLETGTDESIKDIIGAVDCIDGDISRKVKILSTTFSTLSSGDSTVTAQVTNSMGDTIKMRAHVIVRPTNIKAPKINLKENIVYIKKGSKFNELAQIKSVTNSADKKISKKGVKVSHSTVNTKKPGCYYVEYILNEGKTNESRTNLIVMVED